VFEAVDRNDTTFLSTYLEAGGNANALDSRGQSLLYLATGPHGGTDVLRLLLANGADPDKGMGSYTPLMNAASWARLDVMVLVEAGADPLATNAEGKTALDCVGQAGGAEASVIAYLRDLQEKSPQ
jgi:ankyrin repeat protein